MKTTLKTAAAISLAYFVTEFVLDKWVIKSDSGDSSGMILQAEGFGLDDVVRLGAIGIAGAYAVKWAR